MEISLLCGVKVLLCIVDRNGKKVLFSSEELSLFISNYVLDAMITKNHLSNQDVKLKVKFSILYYSEVKKRK